MTVQAKSHFQVFLQGSFVSLTGAVVLGVFNFLIRIHLQAALTPAEYGFLYSVFALVTVFLAFLDLGLGQSGTILMSRCFAAGDKVRAESVFSLVFYLKLVCGTVVFLGFMALAPFLLNSYYQYPEGGAAFIAVSLLLVFQSLETCPSSALDSLKSFGLKNLLQGGKIVLIFLGVWIMIPRFGLNVAAGIFSAASLIFLAVALVVLYGLKRVRLLLWTRLERGGASEMWRLCRWVALGTAGLTLIGNMDTLVLTRLRGLEAVGLYNVALPIVQILQLLSVLPIVFTPIVAELWHKKAEAQIGGICAMLSGLMFVVFWAVLIGAVILGRDAIALTFGRDAVGAADALVILSAGVPFLASANFFMSALNAGNAAGRVAAIIFAGVCLNLVLNLILVTGMGIEGAALATSVSYMVLGVAGYRSLRHMLPTLRLPGRDMLTVAGIGMVCLIAALGLRSYAGGLLINLGGTALLLTVYGLVILPVILRFYRDGKKYLRN